MRTLALQETTSVNGGMVPIISNPFFCVIGITIKSLVICSEYNLSIDYIFPMVGITLMGTALGHIVDTQYGTQGLGKTAGGFIGLVSGMALGLDQIPA